MSYIPEKAMHHATVDNEPSVAPVESGDAGSLSDYVPEAIETKVLPLVRNFEVNSTLGWALGAAGAGVAVAAAAAALFSLRSSTPAKPTRRRATRSTAKTPATKAAGKPATQRKRTTKAKTAPKAAEA